MLSIIGSSGSGKTTILRCINQLETADSGFIKVNGEVFFDDSNYYQKKKEEEFVTQGGIRERMTAARLGYRTNQKETIDNLQHELEILKKENQELKEIINSFKKKL